MVPAEQWAAADPTARTCAIVADVNRSYTLRGPDGDEKTFDILDLKKHVATLSGPGPFTISGPCRCGGHPLASGLPCPLCVNGRFTDTFATADDVRRFVNPTM